MIATLGAAALSVLSGVVTEGIIRGVDSYREPEEQEYLENCVERAVVNTADQHDITETDLREVFETAHPDASIEELGDRPDIEQLVEDLSDSMSIDESQAKDVILWFLEEVERQLVRKPSMGLPIIVNCLERIAEDQQTTNERLERIDDQFAVLKADINDVLEAHESDLSELERRTDRELSITPPPGFETFLKREERENLIRALSREQSVIVTGPAGVGKSTLVKSVVERWDGPRFLLRADQLPANDAEGLRAELRLEHPLPTVLEAIAKREMSVLLAVDQLDEVLGTQTGRMFSSLLDQCAALDNVVVVGVTREWGLQTHTSLAPVAEDDRFEQIPLSEFTKDQTKEGLATLGISQPSEELIQVSQRALEFSLVAELITVTEDTTQTAPDPEVVGTIMTRVQLWRRYVEEVLKKRIVEEAKPAPSDVITIAAELAEQSIRGDEELLELQRDRPEKVRALERADVLLQARKGRSQFEFRHSQLRAYFYANDLAYREATFDELPEDIPDATTGEILAWLFAIYEADRDDANLPALLKSIFEAESTYTQGVFLLEISKRTPQTIRIETIEKLLAQIEDRPLLRGRFYHTVDERWIEPLYKARAFDPLTDDHLDYFYTIVQESLEEMGIVLGDARPTVEISRVRYINALSAIPPAHRGEAVDQLLGLLADHPRWQGRELFKLIGQLVDEDDFDRAMTLLEYALHPEWDDDKHQPRYPQRKVDIYSHFDDYILKYYDRVPDQLLTTIETALREDFQGEYGVDPITAPEDETRIPSLPVRMPKLQHPGLNWQHTTSGQTGVSIPQSSTPAQTGVEARYYLIGILRDTIANLWWQEPSDTLRSRLLRYLDSQSPFPGIAIYALIANPTGDINLVTHVLTQPRYYNRLSGKSDLQQLLRESAPHLEPAHHHEVLETINLLRGTVFTNPIQRNRFLAEALHPIADRLEGPLAEAYADIPDHMLLAVENDNQDSEPNEEAAGFAIEESSHDLSVEEFISECLLWQPTEEMKGLVPHISTDLTQFLDGVSEWVRNHPQSTVSVIESIELAHPLVIATILDTLATVTADLDPEDWRQVTQWTHSILADPDEWDSRIGLSALAVLRSLADQNPTHRDVLGDALLAALTHPDAGPAATENALYRSLAYPQWDPPLNRFVRLKAMNTVLESEVLGALTGEDTATLLGRAIDDTRPMTGLVFSVRLQTLFNRGWELSDTPLHRVFPASPDDKDDHGNVTATLGAARGLLDTRGVTVFELYDGYSEQHQNRLKYCIGQFIEVLNQFSVSFIQSVRGELGKHLASIVLTTETTSSGPPHQLRRMYENLATDQHSSLKKIFDPRPGTAIIPEGLQAAVEAEDMDWVWNRGFDLWHWRLDTDDKRPYEMVQFLQYGKALLNRGIIVPHDLVAKSIPIAVEEFGGWKEIEFYLAEHATYEVSEALELYRVLCESYDPEPFETSTMQSRSILEPGLISANTSTTELAVEVAEVVAETTGDQAILSLLDQHR